MNIAYLISAHIDAPQLKRLIDALHTDAEYFVHIDKKSDVSQFTTIISAPNVHFIENRIDVRWGTILEVEYQMNLIKAAIDYPRHFDRIFFLSGMDYPLWTNEHITLWLEEQGDREILQGICMDTSEINDEQRQLYSTARPFFDVKCLGNKWNQKLSVLCRKILKLCGRKKRLTLKNGWKLYKGSAWWCISEELAAYVYFTYNTLPDVREYFVDSFGQAETVIQTIAFNNPEWAQRCILTEGAYPGLAALTPLHFIIYEPVIKIMEASDYPMLMESGRMFTRKLVSGRSDELVDILKDGRK